MTHTHTHGTGVELMVNKCLYYSSLQSSVIEITTFPAKSRSLSLSSVPHESVTSWTTPGVTMKATFQRASHVQKIVRAREVSFRCPGEV